MHNMSAHQLSQYYQTQWVPTIAWTDSFKWYVPHKVAYTKIFLNFYLSLPPTRQDLTQGQWPEGWL